MIEEILTSLYINGGNDEEIIELKDALRDLGYNLSDTADYDAETEEVIKNF